MSQPDRVTSKERRQGAPRRGLSRDEAASYIGVSATMFDAMVADRRMPRPRAINSRRVWDLRELDAAFDDLPAVGPAKVNEWDQFLDPDHPGLHPRVR